MTSREFIDKRYVGGLKTLVYEGLSKHPNVDKVIEDLDKLEIILEFNGENDFIVKIPELENYDYGHGWVTGLTGFRIEIPELRLEARIDDEFLDSLVIKKNSFELITTEDIDMANEIRLRDDKYYSELVLKDYKLVNRDQKINEILK